MCRRASNNRKKNVRGGPAKLCWRSLTDVCWEGLWVTVVDMYLSELAGCEPWPLTSLAWPLTVNAVVRRHVTSIVSWSLLACTATSSSSSLSLKHWYCLQYVLTLPSMSGSSLARSLHQHWFINADTVPWGIKIISCFVVAEIEQFSTHYDAVV